jgi:hypothetical protein
MFDSPDYGVDYDEWTYYPPSDFLKLLFQYLRRLPDPLFSYVASIRLRSIWQYLPSTDRARAMRSLLHDESVPAINVTLIFFLLNFFAVATNLPESPISIARELHSCFFVVGTGVNDDGSDILAFMITNARDILMPMSAADVQPTYELNFRNLKTVAPQQNLPILSQRRFLNRLLRNAANHPPQGIFADFQRSIKRTRYGSRCEKNCKLWRFADDEFEENANYINLYIKERKAEEKLKEKHSQSGKHSLMSHPVIGTSSHPALNIPRPIPARTSSKHRQRNSQSRYLRKMR